MASQLNSQIRIGTAGWSFPDWEGFVYPRGFTGDRLTYVAQFIDLIEINTTFYRPADPERAESWAKRASEAKGLVFTAKLWQKFTHERGAIEPLEARNFMDGLKPLIKSGLIGALLMQFPWSFRWGEENLLHIERLRDSFGSYAGVAIPLAVEVRHNSWDRPDFIEFLQQREMTFVNIDQPQLRDCIKPTAYRTSAISYIRLHGRNKKDWFRNDAGRDERYNYLYNAQELSPWLDAIKYLEQKSARIFVVMNNHFHGQALANAIELKSLYLGRKVQVPDTLFGPYPAVASIASNPPAQFELFS